MIWVWKTVRFATLIKETSSFQNLLISDPDCVAEWERRLLGGMSVRITLVIQGI